MNIETILQKLPGILNAIEWYHALGGLFVVSLFFGKKKEWEYEAKLFAPGSNTCSGELKLIKYKKDKPAGKLEISQNIDFKASNTKINVDGIALGHLSLDSSGQYIQAVGSKKHMKYRDKNQIKWNKFHFEYSDFQPGNNQKVEILKDRHLILTGILLKD